MGQSESSNSSSLVKSSNWKPPEKCDKYVEFSSNILAKGKFQRVHQGTRVKPMSKKGRQCVVKHLKTSFTRKQTDWDTTIKIYDEVNKLSNKFNSYAETSRPITFTGVDVMRCIEATPESADPRLNEYVVVEDFISGEYTIQNGAIKMGSGLQAVHTACKPSYIMAVITTLDTKKW